MLHNVPEIFSSQDTVYHYCQTLTAIEHILFEKRLRFSPRKLSIDPIESTKISRSTGGCYPNETAQLEIEKRTQKREEAIRKELNYRDNNTKQLSFCKNSKIEDFKGYHLYPEEYYGFLKPRMWDQYGDRYNGVCLAFSRQKLSEGHNHYSGDVCYKDYNFVQNNHLEIDLNKLDSENFSGEYLQNRIEKQKKIHFRKHSDYIGENEFRLLSLSDKEYDYIDISNALVGVIVSMNNQSEFSRAWFSKFALENEIELLFTYWKNNGISLLRARDIEEQKVYVNACPPEIKNIIDKNPKRN